MLNLDSSLEYIFYFDEEGEKIPEMNVFEV